MNLSGGGARIGQIEGGSPGAKTDSAIQAFQPTVLTKMSPNEFQTKGQNKNGMRQMLHIK
jgi:hypothetical protein